MLKNTFLWAGRSRAVILGGFGVLAASALLYTIVGNGDVGWQANAVRNWNQYGFSTLHGAFVTNPGGFEVLTKPQIYAGHRAASFYPVFAVGKVLGWAGEGALMFHLVFTVLLFGAVWSMLGRTRMAVLGAVATTLCPGYSIYPTVVDPNAVVLYMTVPFAAAVVHILSGTSLSPLKLILLAFLTFAYTSLNWSAALGLGILFCGLLVMPSVPWSRLGIFTGLASLNMVVVAVSCILDKMGRGHGVGGGMDFRALLASYAWGHVNYGAYLTTGKALARIGATTVIGLFPLYVLLAFLGLRYRKENAGSKGFAFLPFVAAALGVLTLKNYFGQHPWMATTMLLPGLVLSLSLLVQRCPIKKESPFRTSVVLSLVAVCFIYATMAVGSFRAYHSEVVDLTSLVRQHTVRADTLVLVESLDPEMAAQAKSISYICDRRVVLLPSLDARLPSGENGFVLSSANLDSRFPVVAKTKKSALFSMSIAKELSDWYASRVSRRIQKDQHFDFAKAPSISLYRLAAPVH